MPQSGAASGTAGCPSDSSLLSVLPTSSRRRRRSAGDMADKA